MCEDCVKIAGDEKDWAVAMVAGHHPACPAFAIDRAAFAENLDRYLESCLERRLAAERSKLQFEIRQEMRAPKAPPALTESLVQVSLFRHLDRKRHKWICPNVTLFLAHQVDLCSATKAGMLHEYEIKLSRSDFRKDAASKPDKFAAMEACLRGESTIRRASVWNPKNFYELNARGPNFFSYVCPEGMIRVDEVPAYAGVMFFDPEHLRRRLPIFAIAKKPTKLHGEPMTAETRATISTALMYRCWKAKGALNG